MAVAGFCIVAVGSTLAVFGRSHLHKKFPMLMIMQGFRRCLEELYKAGEQLYDDTTAQLVVTAVDTTDGEDISDYAVGNRSQMGNWFKEEIMVS